MNYLHKFFVGNQVSIALTLLLTIGSMQQNTVQAQQKLQISDKENSLKKAKQLMDKNDLEGAKLILDKNLAVNPKDSDWRMLLGKYYYLKQQYDKARFELNKAVEYNPGNVDAKQVLVAVEMDTKRYSSAICYVNELLEVNPYWRGLWRKKIDLYRLQGNKIEADRLLKRISQIFPDDKEFKDDFLDQTEARANTLHKSGKLDESIELKKLLLQERPNHLETYIDLIDSYIKTGDYPNAMVSTERGLNSFPNNPALIQKKISLLDHDKRYDEILVLLQQQMKGNQNSSYREQYSYFLLEAARSANDNDPAVLYGKILENDPGNEEAFEHVFNSTIAKQQYDEGLQILRGYTNRRGYTKELGVRELQIYKLKGDQTKVKQLTRTLYLSNSDDDDLRAAYVGLLVDEVKGNMAGEEYKQALTKLAEIESLGDEEQRSFASNAAYTAYFQLGHYSEALNLLDAKMNQDLNNPDLWMKKIMIYEKQQNFEKAASSYEELLAVLPSQDRSSYLSGYGDLMFKRVKEANENTNYLSALNWTNRWLQHDPTNKQALTYGINLSHQVQDHRRMLELAERAVSTYPDEVGFQIKLASAKVLNGSDVKEAYTLVRDVLHTQPFHDQAQAAFVELTSHYAGSLLKNKEADETIVVVDEALKYKPTDKELKYLKGLAYEQLKQYDSAYYYQKNYDPSILEAADFKMHLDYLNNRGYKNDIGISHLRTRFGDNYNIQTISSIEYSRKADLNTYLARVNYSGREGGRGVQGHLEWSRTWNADWSTRLDVALANKYFPKYNLNAALARQFKQDWSVEVGVGYRQLYTLENMSVLNIGVAKDINSFRLEGKLSQFMMDGTWLYNAGIQGKYYMGITKNYLVAMANVGSSPDIDMLDYQYISSFSVVNSMVGFGAGRMITKNVSAAVLGSWYNFESDILNSYYRNLYNLHFQINVAF